jgi:hypothetical protein
VSRYYEIVLTKPGGASVANANTLASINTTFTSFPNGKNDPGALNVELDLLTSPLGEPGGDVGSSTISVEGIPLALLQQSTMFGLQPPPDFTPGWNISVKGGMQAGLPLANPKQAGLLLTGTVQQSWGNWVGTDMNINFVVVAGGYTLGNPGNFVFNWQKGTPLSTAILNTLTVAYPGYDVRMFIGSQYSTSQPVVGIYSTLTQFAKFILGLTRTATSNGVNITNPPGKMIVVADGSVPGGPIQLAFTDLIGQPKWVQPNIMQFMTVMRADIQVYSLVTMPPGIQNLPGLVTTGFPATPSSLKYQTTFQGPFTVQAVRHIGNFRDPNGQSWASVFNAFPTRLAT